MRTVCVRFSDNASYGKPKDYEYYVPDGVDFQKDDKVVVDSPYGGYVICNVTSTKLTGKATKSIVQKVDDTWNKAQKDKEAERQALLLELAKIEKKVTEEMKFTYLRSISPEAALLLNKLERL